MHAVMRLYVRTLLALAAVLLLAACGGDGGGTSGSADGSASVPELHVNGTVEVKGDSFVLTPAAGGETTTFKIGKEISQPELLAFAASNEVVKVSYTPTSEAPVASSVVKSPKFGPDVKNVSGQVVEVSETSITITTGPEQLTFPIAADSSGEFDTPHLEDHAKKKEAVRIYYRSEGGTDQAVGYEDA